MILDRLSWLLLALTTLVAAIFISWRLFAAVDFLYPLWYEVTGIDDTIREYGPQNRYRDHFERTDKAEQVRLFAAIVDAIHHHGEGLAGLNYHDPQGRRLGQLLTQPEIVHLQDVARLVTFLEWSGWTAMALTVLLLLVMQQRRPKVPAVREFILWGGIVLGLLALVILITGAETLFYQLHVWVFPEEHQWFFYYQDSLMTTMMQAPALFGYLAAELAVVGLLLQLAMLAAARRLLGG